MNTYYGHYKGTACPTEFISMPSQSLGFPPQVTYACSNCKQSHSFRLLNTQLVSTPSQRKQFDAFCNQRLIERDVELP